MKSPGNSPGVNRLVTGGEANFNTNGKLPGCKFSSLLPH